MEDAQTSSPACHRSKSVSSQKCTTCLREGENWGMAGCKDYVHQKRIPARASCFLKRKWMTQWPFGEVLCLKGLRCHQGHIRPSAKRCIAHSVRLQFMLKCAENSRRLCSGCGKKAQMAMEAKSSQLCSLQIWELGSIHGQWDSVYTQRPGS